MNEANLYFKNVFKDEIINKIVFLIPDEWLENEPDRIEVKKAYSKF